MCIRLSNPLLVHMSIRLLSVRLKMVLYFLCLFVLCIICVNFYSTLLYSQLCLLVPWANIVELIELMDTLLEWNSFVCKGLTVFPKKKEGFYGSQTQIFNHSVQTQIFNHSVFLFLIYHAQMITDYRTHFKCFMNTNMNDRTKN